MAKTTEEIFQSMVEYAEGRMNAPDLEEMRADAARFAPLPEGYTRLTPQTIDNYSFPLMAIAVPFEDDTTTTLGKEYELREIDSLFGLLTGCKFEFIDDDGDEAGSGGFSLYGWAVKDEIAK